MGETGTAIPLDAIFLDRDGVINRKRPEGDYVKSWEEFEFLPGALEGIRLLAGAARRLIIVTNQRGIARGRMSEEDLARIHARMLEAIRAAGGRIDAVYYCPHEEGACECRKPRPGLFLQAQRDFPEIDLARSLVVGDAPSDLEAARRVGARAALIGAAGGGFEAELAAGSLEELAQRLGAEPSSARTSPASPTNSTLASP